MVFYVLFSLYFCLSRLSLSSLSLFQSLSPSLHSDSIPFVSPKKSLHINAVVVVVPSLSFIFCFFYYFIHPLAPSCTLHPHPHLIRTPLSRPSRSSYYFNRQYRRLQSLFLNIPIFLSNAFIIHYPPHYLPSTIRLFTILSRLSTLYYPQSTIHTLTFHYPTLKLYGFPSHFLFSYYICLCFFSCHVPIYGLKFSLLSPVSVQVSSLQSRFLSLSLSLYVPPFLFLFLFLYSSVILLLPSSYSLVLSSYYLLSFIVHINQTDIYVTITICSYVHTFKYTFIRSYVQIKFTLACKSNILSYVHVYLSFFVGFIRPRFILTFIIFTSTYLLHLLHLHIYYIYTSTASATSTAYLLLCIYESVKLNIYLSMDLHLWVSVSRVIRKS